MVYLKVPAGLDLGEIGASFLAKTQVATSLTVH